MLVIDNGAFKSGSTWLYQILSKMHDFSAPPQRYLNPDWYHPSIAPSKLWECLESADYKHNDYLCKNHFGNIKHRHLILSYPNVYVLGITRDIKDVVVSAYYHYKRVENYEDDFATYYWSKGRMVARNVLQYNQLWSVTASNLFVTSYEELKMNTDHVIGKMGVFLGLELSKERINQIIEQLKTDFSKKKGEDSHFRKGEIGDWQNHLSEEMCQDLEQIIIKQNNSTGRKFKIKMYDSYYKTKKQINNLIKSK